MTRPGKERRHRHWFRFLFMDFGEFFRRFILRRQAATLARGPRPKAPVPAAAAEAQQHRTEEHRRPGFSTGIDLIDKQHQQLMTTIQKLQKALQDGSGKQVASDALDYLIRYTDDHFTLEEAYMEHIAYPGLSGHRASHAKIRAAILQLHQRVTEGDPDVAMELSAMLFQYLSDHIMREDSSYVEHARTR